jgi:hypothetical protein
MPDLYITMATPNPAGKDRVGNRADNDQLNGEWIQLQNTSAKNLSLEGVHLDHTTFDAYCRKTGEESLAQFHGTMEAGTSWRVHTGTGKDWWEGTVRHVYVGRNNYAWNNRCGDAAYIRTEKNVTIDWASYDPNPGEGAVLRRIVNTNKLV